MRTCALMVLNLSGYLLLYLPRLSHYTITLQLSTFNRRKPLLKFDCFQTLEAVPLAGVYIDLHFVFVSKSICVLVSINELKH